MTSYSSLRALLVTLDDNLLLLERGHPSGPSTFTLPTFQYSSSLNAETELLTGLRTRFGIEGQVASLIHIGFAGAGAVPTYVVRVKHRLGGQAETADPTSEAWDLQQVVATDENLAALPLCPEDVAEVLRRSGGTHRLLGLADLREDGVGQSAMTAVAVRAASRAARAIRDAVAGGAVEIATKFGAHDLVTTADRAAEAAAIAEIRRHRPDDAILAEESGNHTGTTGVQWIIDPVDGTGNFVLGRADYAISIAAYRDDIPLTAVIYRPVDRAWAATGENGQTGTLPLACTATSSLAEAVVAIGFSHDPAKRFVSVLLLEHLFPHIRDFRRIASACCDQLAVATGTLDAYVGVGLRRWDYAAGTALVSAAGGSAEEIELASGVHAVVVAAPGIADELISLLRSVPAEQLIR
ncbi:inositol monophosphatase [Streptacidiphilus sp. EB103A]|uniref:inositol monophosphatase family protein n=1 Tax=Streptacidiphilus sp. EB103A TaxID=3156275 RepID=UPI003511B553